MTRLSLLGVGVMLGVSASATLAQSSAGMAQIAKASAAPEVGAMAPDFTASWADASGPHAQPVKLSDLRGKVVVLAFFPLDRSQGCTIEMHKFRDEYTKIFGPKAGEDVVVLPISIDSIAAHVSWAHDDHFQFSMVSDPEQKVSSLYGSTMPGRKYDSRTVFVIGRDGKVAYHDPQFGALNQQDYDALTSAVAKAAGM
jgi:peroxiredoxin Q/BCP